MQTKTWDSQGIALHLLDLNLNTASPMGRFFLSVTASFAELERAQIGERTRVALAHKKAQGFVLGQKVIETTEEGQAVLSRILTLRDSGKTLREVAASLNAEGFATKRGGRWQAETVRKILARQVSA